MKWASLILAGSLFSSLLLYYDFSGSGQAAEGQEPLVGSNDSSIAADISNMTGVTTEEIMRLRQDGMDWNTVLSKLRTQQYSIPADTKSLRLQELASEGVGEDWIEQLVQSGYSQDEVLSAKLAVERVHYQLTNLTTTAASSKNQHEDKKEDLEKLSSAFQVSEAIRWTVLLRATLGGTEQALNEYLEALVLELNLEECLSSREEYLKKKEEKLAARPLYQPITVQSIEEWALQALQASNEASRSQPEPTAGASWTGQDGQAEAVIPGLPQPEAPVPATPAVRSVKPVNPAEQIMSEVQSLNPNRPK